MAARRTTTQSRPGKVRHGGRPADDHAVLRWLQVGAVAAGVGAAVAAGQGVAAASTGTDGSGPAADSGDNTSTHRHFGIHRSVAGTPAKSETDSAASASEAGTDPASPSSTSVLHSPLHIGVPSHPFAGLLRRPGAVTSQGTPTPDVTPSYAGQGTRTLQTPAGPTTVSAHLGLAGAARIREAAVAPEAVQHRFTAITPTDTSQDTVAGTGLFTKAPAAGFFSTRPAYPAQVTATPVTLQSIAADLSAWSLGTPDTNIPAAPVGNVLQALRLGVRRVHYTLLNSYPHAAPTQVVEDPTTGVVTGALNGYDADGDHLTYAVVTPPERGAVELVGGTYVYTPDADLAASGGTDTFTVSIDDRPGNPWHVHGLSEILGVCGPPRLSTQEVTITVAQVITNPSIVATAGAPDPGTGAVLLTTVVTPQTIPVTVTAANSGNGTLLDNGDGTWTYTPNSADRTAASQVGAPVTYETITFTATNTTDPTKVGTDAVDVAIEPLVNTVVDSYAVDRPWSVAVSADGKTAYVTSIYNGVVSILNTKTGDLITSIQLPAHSEPISPVVNPTDASVYVPNFTTNGGVLVINTNNVLSGAIAASNPRNVAFSPDGTTAYVANQSINGSGNITVINAATGDVIETLAVPANFAPQDLAVSSDGTQLYVLNNAGAGSVAVLDASNGNVATTIAVPGAIDMAISPDRSTVYVATVGTNVAVIDTASNTVSQNPITVNGQPRTVAVSPDGKTVYVTVATTGATDSLAVVNRTTGDISYIAVPKDANTVAISQDGTHAYVTSTSSNVVTVISLGPATPAATVSA